MLPAPQPSPMPRPFPILLCLTCNAPRARILHAIQSISLFMSNLFVPPVPSDANRWCRTSFSRFSYIFSSACACACDRAQSKHVPLSRRGSTMAMANCIWRERERKFTFPLITMGPHIAFIAETLSISHSHSISVGNQHKRAAGKLRRRP